MSVAKQWRDRGYKMTELTAEILDRGFVGNGCGARFLDRVFLMYYQWRHGADLKISCHIHDASYSISRSQKSQEHKRLEDTYFESNIHIDCKKLPKKVRDKLATRFHAGVTLAGDAAYWKK